jgi:hypothetical protein
MMRIAEKSTEHMPTRPEFEDRNSHRQRNDERKDRSGNSPFSSAHYSREPAEEHEATSGTHHGGAVMPRVRHR